MKELMYHDKTSIRLTLFMNFEYLRDCHQIFILISPEIITCGYQTLQFSDFKGE